MNGYFIRSSRVTPSVYFNPKKGILDMRGKSSPEDPLRFYNYVLNSLDAYTQAQGQRMITNLAFEYFNTSSSKCLYIFMKKLAKMGELGKQVVVNWYFEEGDEDMREAGEDLESMFDVTFNFKEVSEIKVLGDPAPQQKVA